MPRPFPVLPRGKPTRKRAATLLLACPKLSPEWELSALSALMKPRTMRIFQHQSGEQIWPDPADGVVEEVAAEVQHRLNFRVPLSLHAAGDYHLVAEVPREQLEEAKAFLAALTLRLPGLWFRLGKLLLRDGKFFRREQGYKLRLVPATNVHLRRDLRAAMKGLL